MSITEGEKLLQQAARLEALALQVIDEAAADAYGRSSRLQKGRG